MYKNANGITREKEGRRKETRDFQNKRLNRFQMKDWNMRQEESTQPLGESLSLRSLHSVFPRLLPWSNPPLNSPPQRRQTDKEEEV